MTKTIQSGVIELFLATGAADPTSPNWPGSNVLERCKNSERILREALLAAVNRLVPPETFRLTLPIPQIQVLPMVEKRIQPMVSGLFPPGERSKISSLLSRSVVFVATDNISQLIMDVSRLHTAWLLANMYTLCFRECLSKDAPHISGYSEGTDCYISLDYFDEANPFADYVVHEVAHVFHNAKRVSIGLDGRERDERLIPIAYSKRETFAYACEAYSRILEQYPRKSERLAKVSALQTELPIPSDSRVSGDEYLDILSEAAKAANGWRVIARRCAS